MPLYVKGYNQTLGDTSDNYATSAAQIYEHRGHLADGFYYIQASGMSNPQKLWCDFKSGGSDIGYGFQRFWWWGTKGVNGNETSDTCHQEVCLVLLIYQLLLIHSIMVGDAFQVE